MIKHVLLVDPVPDKNRLFRLPGVLHNLAEVTAVEDFLSARMVLRKRLPDLLVTDLRLHAYNGIHLALLANRNHTRCVVYAETHDLGLARQVQASGAFYVRLEHLVFVLPAFVRSALPLQDRRDPAVLDRRRASRSGRRSTDLPALYAALRQPNVEIERPR
jgi:DNA-binding NtrC family response regulator